MTIDAQFQEWLAAYSGAIYNSDWNACEKLFAANAAYLTTPFNQIVRGGKAIAKQLEGDWSRFERIRFTAEPIAPGWAHWHVAGYLEALEEPFQFDGILNAEFGPDGACTRLVLWTETLSPGETDLLTQRDA